MITLSEMLENAQVHLTAEEDHKIEGFLTIGDEQLPFQGLACDNSHGWEVSFASEADEWVEENETDAHNAEDLAEALVVIVYEALEEDNLHRVSGAQPGATPPDSGVYMH